MNQLADMPPILRDQLESIMDYRGRTNLLAEIQMGLTGIYLCCLGFVMEEELEKVKSSFLELDILRDEIAKRNTTKMDNIFIQLSILEYLLKLRSHMYQKMAWTVFHALIALLHFVSSFILIKATKEDAPKVRAIMFCKWAERLNYAFFVADVQTFVRGSFGWQLTAEFVSYRFIFNFVLKNCLKTIESLAPPPPGHQ